MIKIPSARTCVFPEKPYSIVLLFKGVCLKSEDTESQGSSYPSGEQLEIISDKVMTYQTAMEMSEAVHFTVYCQKGYDDVIYL